LDLQEHSRSQSRSTEPTKAALIKAALSVFADFGYDGGSVRLITQRADANQAAVNYHFGGKEGLYRAVLHAAADALEKESFLDAAELEARAPEEALRLYLRQFLSPLVKRDRVSQYLRIFAFEGVRPGPVFKEFVSARPPRIFRLAERVARRFLPADAASEAIALRALWLAQQPVFFVREAELLALPPFSLRFDEGGFERLVDTLTCLSLAGLKGADR
jgi:AcrR family transcriptional regulator